MDKRSILFVLFVSLAFFGVNFYFSSERDKENRRLLQENARVEEKKRSALESKLISKEELPLVDVEGGQKGLLLDGNLLVLAWSTSLPEKLEIRGEEKTLLTHHYLVGSPVLYGKKGFDYFNIASVPREGSFDLQLVTLQASPSTFLGLYEEGTLRFPLTSPSSNAIALYKTESGYLPLGFYENDSKIFVEFQRMPLFTPLIRAKSEVPLKREAQEKYYVLENETLQLVFSNVGGALSEINLPFKSEENRASVVKEIGFDREMVEKKPKEALFPSVPYSLAGEREERRSESPGGYYPLLRRDVEPSLFALNLTSDYKELEKLPYEVVEFTKEKIVLQATHPMRKITKSFTLSKEAPYVFDYTLRIEGTSKGLFVTSGVPEVEIMSNTSSPQVQYKIERKNKVEVNKLDLPKPKEAITMSSIAPDWVANSNGYLGLIIDPLTEIGSGFRTLAIPGATAPTRLSLLDSDLYKLSKYPGYSVEMPLPAQGGVFHFRIYAGPFEEATLKKVDQIYSDPTTGYNPDYLSCKTFYGWFSFITKPFAKMLFLVMKFFYMITSSWGFSIILLTIFLRVLLYPLNSWSIKSMRRMQELSPEVQAIQKKHKKDAKKAQMEIMQLYREKKVNPFMGCFPILIQLPFLIAMFDLLKSSFQLRGAGFIPGWIDNLTYPDVLFSWNTPIFFIGNEFHLLPLILGVVMLLQQRLSSTMPKDPAQMTDQQRQQKAMSTLMAIFFTFMFYNFPSGLNIYWLSSMLLGILQQALFTAKANKQPASKTVHKTIQKTIKD